MKKFDKFKIKKWKHFINESKNDTPFEIKKVTSLIRDRIKFRINSFSEEFDFTDDIFPISFTLVVNFIVGDNISYTSKIDTLGIIKNNFEKFILPIDVVDDEIRIEELISVIHHELRHVYDLMVSDEEYDTKSFWMNPVISNIRKESVKYRYFIDLVYLSLEHELVARNSMLYDYLRHLNIYDKDILMNKVQTTKSYSYLNMLKNFDVDKFVNSFSIEELLLITNKLIKQRNSLLELNDKLCLNKKDLIEYYNHWNDLFIRKSSEYLEYINTVIIDVVNDVKPYNENVQNILGEHKYYHIRKYKNIFDYYISF